MSILNIANSANAGFWEVGAYKANVKRVKDGLDQLDDFTRMIKERSELETKYGKALQFWNQKWSGHVDKTVPNGTIKDCWAHVLEEGHELAKVHLDVKDRLNDELTKTVALFKKENHHPSAFRAPKEMRDIEEAFEKAQRQWKKLYDKTESSRKAYHNAFKNEKSAYVQLVNSQSDTSISLDSAEKLKERHEKCKEEANKLKGVYETQLSEITNYNTVYVENMSFVFEKCQQMELKRMKFVAEMIRGMQKVLVDLVSSSRITTLHKNIDDRFTSNGDQAFHNDLNEWSRTYGVDAPMKWPEFEEYTPEIRNIASRKNSQKDTGGVVLTRQTLRADDDSVVSMKGASSCDNILRETSNIHTSETGLKRFSMNGEFITETPASKTRNQRQVPRSGGGMRWSASEDRSLDSKQPSPSNINPLADPFPMPTPERSESVALSSGSYEAQSGLHSVANTESSESLKCEEFTSRGHSKVLYDYTPVEEDEIPLEKGETIEVLSEPDQLGWAFGRGKTGRAGLFPYSYVQPVLSELSN